MRCDAQTPLSHPVHFWLLRLLQYGVGCGCLFACECFLFYILLLAIGLPSFVFRLSS